MKAYIETIRKTIQHTQTLIIEAIVSMVSRYGEDGMELNCHIEDCFSAYAEVTPNEFKKIERVRANCGKLEMMLEGENEWDNFGYVCDLPFLLDEVERVYAMDNEYM